jgi:hypothetical protein
MEIFWTASGGGGGSLPVLLQHFNWNAEEEDTHNIL